MDKRKGIILAVIIFLLIGLGTFVFANESLNEGNKTNKNPNGANNESLDTDGSGNGGEEEETPNEDDSDKEDSNSGDSSNGNISNNDINQNETDVIIGDGNNSSNSSEDNKEDTPQDESSKPADTTAPIVTILDKTYQGVGPKNSIGYINTDIVLSLAEENLTVTIEKDGEPLTFTDGMTLSSDGSYVLSVRDSNNNVTVVEFSIDKTAPVIAKVPANGSYVNHSVSPSITDTDVATVTLTKNGAEVEGYQDDMYELSHDGTYTLTVTDEAGNETTTTFTIDKTNPVLLVNGEEVTDGSTIYVNKDAVMTVNETNLATFTSNGSDRTTNVLNGSWTASGESSYSIVVTDKADNTTTYTVIVDKTPIAVNHLYVLNNTHNEITVSDTVKYKVIGNNQKLYVEYVLKEEFTSTPTITIGGKSIKMTCNTASWDNTLYKCDAQITITEDMNLVSGEVIPFEITGVKDLAGNETIVTEDNVTDNTSKGYSKVIYDNEAPIYNSLGLVNITHYRENPQKDNLNVANIGDTLRVMISFNEALEAVPSITIGGVTKTLNLDEAWTKYSYWADIEITKDMNLKDGNIDFEITGYADAAGNVGTKLTSQDIKNTSYQGVVLDTTAPKAGWVYILNLSDENNRQTIGNGQTLRVEVKFDGEIASIPKLEIGNMQSTDFTSCKEQSYGYVCVADIKIDNTLANLEHGKDIPFKITNILDAAGNETVLDNDDVVYTANYGQVKFDGEAPLISVLGITGFFGEAEYDPHYVTDGKGIRILTYFKEELGTAPTVTINGHEFVAYKAKDTNKETNTYSYYVDIADVATLGLDDGKIAFTVSGYKDVFGNEGVVLTEDDTNSSYDKVIYDKTPATFNFANGNTYNNFTVKLSEANLERLEVYSYGTGKTTTYKGDEGLTWVLDSGNCKYKLMAYDLAGNYSEIWVYHDSTAPVVTGTGKVAAKDVLFTSGKKYQEVSLVVTDNDLKEVKLVNELTKKEEIICKYNWDNTDDCTFNYNKEGKYTLVVLDRANNKSEYELIIDTTAPEFDLSSIPTQFEVGLDVYEYPQPGEVTDNYDGELSFSKVNMNWYHKNADGTKGSSTTCFGYENWNTSLNACSLGDYIITYDVSDEAGNKAYAEKTITLQDTTPASLTFNREDGYVVDLGSTYEELGASVTDNVDQAKVIMPRTYVRFDLQMNNLYEYYDEIDTTKEGMYLAVFDYTDSAGNVSDTLKRWIVVKDVSAPVITGVESNTTYFAGIGNHGYPVGGIRLKFSDNSGYIKVEINGQDTWTVDYTNTDSYNLFVNEGMPYHEELDDVSICATDRSGNKTCVDHVTIKKFSSDSVIDKLKEGGIVTLPPDVTINLNGNIDILAGTTIIGDASTKIVGSLTLTGNNITLKNVNVENSNGASITINNDVKNVVIDGGNYTTVDANLQGEGTIRGMGNNTVSISNTILHGGIHLFNYAGTQEDIKNNLIILDYQGETPLSGIIITTSEEKKYIAQAIYINNSFTIQNQPNSYYVLIQRPDWSTIDSVTINN